MRPQFALTAIVLLACSGGSVSDTATGPVAPVDTTRPGPATVQRSSLTVRVRIESVDATVASAAGVGVSGIAVRIVRTGATSDSRTATTSDDGTARFDNLLEGVYQVSIERRLNAAEIAKVPIADREVTVFAGGGQQVLSPPANAAVDVALVANRRGSVVLSEVFAFNAPPSMDLLYGMGTYIAVYNNSDTTAYLDGMLISVTPLTLHQGFPPNYPCDGALKAERIDSTAMTVALIHQFPGTGREFPILPGQERVVAMDAIDHRIAAPGKQQVDLSRADFEQIGSPADTDNPFAAKMINLFAGPGPFGRGYGYLFAPTAYALSLPAARGAMVPARIISTTGLQTGQPFDVYRIPQRYVIDVMGVDFSPQEFGYDGSNRCVPFIAPVFERAPAPLVNTMLSRAIARKSLGRTADGREILQRTRTSARDLEYADPLRRSLNK